MMFYWINAKKIIGKILIFLSLLYLLFVILEILFFIFYFFIFIKFKFISKFDKTTEFIFLIFIYCIAIFILLKNKKLFKTNIDNTPIIYNFNLYKLKCFNDYKNKMIIFHPEEIKIKDKNDILYFLKLLDIYSFANRKYLVRFVFQITLLNIIIFLFSSFFILTYKDQIYHLIWIGITALTYILYFFYWVHLFSYEKINQIYNKLILKPNFKKNLTFYIIPLRKSLSLSEIFKYSFSEREKKFEKYIDLMIQILLPISYIAFLTFYIGFKSSKG